MTAIALTQALTRLVHEPQAPIRLDPVEGDDEAAVALGDQLRQRMVMVRQSPGRAHHGLDDARW